MAFARAVTHTKTLVSPSSGVEDKVYGEDYVSLSSHASAVSGADVGGIPYCPTATTETTSANLIYREAGAISGAGGTGPQFQVGSGSTTAQGWILGYAGNSGRSIIWPTSVTPSTSNYRMQVIGSDLYLNTDTSAGSMYLQTAQSTKITLVSTAGAGPSITAGTATTDVNALSLTQTWNAAGVTFTGIKYTITDTASASGSLAMQILGGASGTTNLFATDKNGGNYTSRNGGIAFYVNVSGQNPVGFMRNSTVGGFHIHGGDAATPSDSNGNTVFISNTVMRHSSSVVAGWSSSNVTQSTDIAFARNAAGRVEVNNGTAGTYRDLKARLFNSSGTAFASLPTAVAGDIAYITDSATATWGATIAGGGANKVLAFFNGTNWTVCGA